MHFQPHMSIDKFIKAENYLIYLGPQVWIHVPLETRIISKTKWKMQTEWNMVAWILGSEFLHIEDLTWILNRILRIDLVKKKKLKTIFFFKKILQYMRSQTQVIKKKKKKNK